MGSYTGQQESTSSNGVPLMGVGGQRSSWTTRQAPLAAWVPDSGGGRAALAHVAAAPRSHHRLCPSVQGCHSDQATE